MPYDIGDETEIDSNPIELEGRAQSIKTPELIARDVFPTEAWEFEDPDTNTNPKMILLDPWDLNVEHDVLIEGDLTVEGTLTPGGVPPGCILSFGGDVAPSGYLLCDGSSLLRATYAALFAVIGTAFGTADGTHFNLPDSRGRFLRFKDAGAGRDPDAGTRTAMAGGGATGDNVGSIQGDATKRPNTNFTTGNPSVNHTHLVDCWGGGGSSGAHVYACSGCTAHYHQSSHGVSVWHIHTVTGGGDSETRSINFYAEAIIKY